MKIKEITLRIISQSLKAPFTTHLETVTNRECIIVEVLNDDGIKGYGEVVAFSSPWYTEETVQTAFHMLRDFFIPLIKNQPVQHPAEVTDLLDKYRRNHMAKAGLETAIWDLYAKEKQTSLSCLLGGVRSVIPSGVVVATNSFEKAVRQIDAYLEDGYQRVKIKISPEHDYELIQHIRARYPNLPIMADANSAYCLEDINRLKALDEFGLMMIEQPLAHDDIIEHARLQKEMSTPICLDESIVTYEDARKAIELGSCRVINIKIGRVGGLQNAKRIHDLALAQGVQVWVGGMLEFGISRAHNIALASLPGFTIPGDISASSRYWEEDITVPEVTVEKGFIEVPTGHGIGFSIHEKCLQRCTIYQEKFVF